MVHSLTRLLSHVMTAKRDLKRVYYTTRNQDSKFDAKELVAATITLQKLLEDLVTKTEAEMLKYRNFGRKSLNEIGTLLEEMNLSFGMDISKYMEPAKQS